MLYNHNFKNLRELFQQKYSIQPSNDSNETTQNFTDRKKIPSVFSTPLFQNKQSKIKVVEEFQLPTSSRSPFAKVQPPIQRENSKGKIENPFIGNSSTINTKILIPSPSIVIQDTDRPRQQSFHQQQNPSSGFQTFFQYNQMKEQNQPQSVKQINMSTSRPNSQESKTPPQGVKIIKSPRSQVKIVQLNFSQIPKEFSIQSSRNSISSHYKSSSIYQQSEINKEKSRSPMPSNSFMKKPVQESSLSKMNFIKKQSFFDSTPHEIFKSDIPHSSKMMAPPNHQKHFSGQIEIQKKEQIELIERLIQSQKKQFAQRRKPSQNIQMENLFEKLIVQKAPKNNNSQQNLATPISMKYDQPKRIPEQQILDFNSSDNNGTEEEEDEIRIMDIYNGVLKNNFIFHYVIGKGGFGKVWKVELKKTRVLYAMKEMSKAKVIAKRSVSSVMNEKQLLSQLEHPFLVNMNYAFQDKENLYLVMDLLTGGDLRFHIGKMRRFREAQTTLEYLHVNNIIHRDLKPENLVLDYNGYVRLTDLGIARVYKPENNADTSGTPGYMAPEVMCRQNHGIAVDYFALGVITYEFMLGRRPYQGKSRKEIRDHILAKQVQIKPNEIPSDYSFEAADFANRLIQRKPANRLGFNGPQEVKNHPWFKGYQWQKLFNKEVEAPYIPLSIDDNYEYLNQISEDNDSQDELIQQNVVLLRKNSVQNLFAGYSYDINAQKKNKLPIKFEQTKSTASTYGPQMVQLSKNND